MDLACSGRGYIADLVQAGEGRYAGGLVTRDGQIEVFPSGTDLLTQAGMPLPEDHWHQFILRDGLPVKSKVSASGTVRAPI